MKIHKLISERKSIRAFSDKRIDDKTLVTLLEAARWAASSMNEQPWRFIVARKDNEEAFGKMLECMNESNRNWAKDASVLLLTVATKKFTSIELENEYAWHDVGLAIGNLSLQAMSMDIYLHQIGGFDKEVSKKIFNIPVEFQPISIIAIGYRGNADQLPPVLRDRELKPRIRKPLSELVYLNNFGVKDNLFAQTGEIE